MGQTFAVLWKPKRLNFHRVIASVELRQRTKQKGKVDLMNAKPLIAFLAVLSLSGCIVYERTPTPAPVAGDVTFTWSFTGLTCSDVPQVKSVIVSIPGETLMNAGIYPCTANNYPGIVLHNFRPGNYTFTLQAVGYGDEQLFTGTGSFSVNGATRVTVDLTPVGGPNSYAYLTWHFPASAASSNPTCTQAGIATVDVAIDGVLVPNPFNCADGFTQPGVATPFIAAGTHSIDIQGLSGSGYLMYRYTGTLQTFVGGPVSADYLLPWAVGGVAVKWQFTDGTTAKSCGSGGISQVWVNFKDSTGHLVYGTNGDPQACSSVSIPYNFLQPGTYEVTVFAYGAGTSEYWSTTPPLVTVTAGVFSNAAPPILVQLFRTK
jgi:hypothetical protein